MSDPKAALEMTVTDAIQAREFLISFGRMTSYKAHVSQLHVLIVALASVLGLLTKALYLYAFTPILMLVYMRFVALRRTYSRDLGALGKLKRATMGEALEMSSGSGWRALGVRLVVVGCVTGVPRWLESRDAEGGVVGLGL